MKSKRKPCYASKGLPKVPGKPKGTDIIPAWLTPGEAVLSPGAAEMLGRGNVQALNKAASTMRLGTPQYKAEGEEQMQPGMELDSAMLGNQRADEILSDPGMFDSREVQAANRYMDPAGLAGGPSPIRDAALLGGISSLGTVQQLAKAQQGLFGVNQPIRLGGDDGTSEGLGEAQEAIGSALSYGRQAAQEASQEGMGVAQSAIRDANERARYMSQGGIVQPGYYALGTAYAGMGQNILEDALRNEGIGREMSQSRAMVPAGPRVSMPTGSLGEGQGIKVFQNALGNQPVSIPSSALPQAPIKPVDPMAAKMGQYSATPARLTDPIAQKMASAAYTPPAASPPAPGLASRLGQGLARNLNTIPAVAQTAGDIASVMRSDANPVIKGLASAESVGNAAFGALADRVGGGRLAGAGMVPMAASGYRPITAGLNAAGVQTPLSYMQNPERQGGLGPRTPSSPMSAEQTQRFLDNTNRNANILGSRGATATGDNTRYSTDQASADAAAKQSYYQEGMTTDGASSRLTPSQAQIDFVNSGRPASSLPKDELYKIYPSAKDADARAAFDAKQQAMQPRQGLAAPPVNTIGDQMAELNMSAQRQAQAAINDARTVLNNPGRYTANQRQAAEIMLQRLAPVAMTGVASSDKFYITDKTSNLTAAQANQANSTARLNYSNASLNDEKVRQERMGQAPTRVGSGPAKANDPGKFYSVDTGNDTLGNLVIGPNGQAYRIDAKSNNLVPVSFPQQQTPLQLFSRFNSPAELIAWARSKEQRDKYSDVSDEALANEWNKVQQAR